MGIIVICIGAVVMWNTFFLLEEEPFPIIRGLYKLFNRIRKRNKKLTIDILLWKIGDIVEFNEDVDDAPYVLTDIGFKELLFVNKYHSEVILIVPKSNLNGGYIKSRVKDVSKVTFCRNVSLEEREFENKLLKIKEESNALQEAKVEIEEEG